MLISWGKVQRIKGKSIVKKRNINLLKNIFIFAKQCGVTKPYRELKTRT